MDWSSYYPAFISQQEPGQNDTGVVTSKPRPLLKDVDVADIGCGFGGLLVGLAPKLPDSILLGETYYG
jgi:tRNA G46 methylase TrmB